MKLYNGDCLQVMEQLINDGVKVDAIITDPPYGTSACKWDSVIPFEEMWKMLKALRKDNTPIVLFGSEPFSSSLRMSNIKEYKYDWVWEKDRPTGLFNAKKRVMKYHENISVFYKHQSVYNPQMREGKKNHKRGSSFGKSEHYTTNVFNESSDDTKKYPSSVLYFKRPHPPVHPTQKPLALMEYLVKTYTNEGDTVLDFTMGSGTTGVACKNLNRNFIGIELDDKYFEIAKERIEKASSFDLFKE